MNSLFAEKLVGRLDERLIAAWLYTPLYSQNNFSASDISTLLLNDCEDKINDFYFLGFTLKFVEPFLLGILSIFTLGLLYPGILLPFFLLGIPSVLCNIFFAKKISRYSRKYLSSFEEFVGCYNHALEYMNEIKICALNAVFKKKLEDTNKQIIRYEQEKEFTSINADFISHLWETFSLIMCVCLCLYLSLRHDFSSADITFVLTLSPLIFNFFYCFTNTWNYFIEISNSVERVYKTLEELPEINLMRSNTPLHTLQDANIYFKDVSFSYLNSKPILSNISFEISAHTHNVLVGKNGIGKSTVLRLMLGDLTPLSGSMFFLTDNESHILYKDYFTFIPQEPEILNISYHENLILDCKKYKYEPAQKDIIAVTKSLELHDHIMSLKHGYETIVTENGKGLSLGEIQKIAIARSLLSPAPFILLDEPDHALDRNSLHQMLHFLSASRKTLFMISHSLKELQAFDRIYFLKDQYTIISGTHDYLLDTDEEYRHLYEHAN